VPEVTISIPDKYDKEIRKLSVDRNVRSKKVMIEEIVKEYFDTKNSL
jgi:hypothetical protein